MKKITLYTDGACSGNPGKGGWAAILIYKNHEKEISGFNENTTNNRMELQAVIEGLKLLKESCSVDIYSDSAYIINTFNQEWLTKWQNNNWKTSTNKEVSNIDLWKDLLQVSSKHEVFWKKVKGHSTNKYNNRCDELAKKEIEKNSK